MSEIKPKKIKTKNILKSLNNFALENEISVDKCTYTINKVITYIKARTDVSFNLFNENINIHYHEKEKIANDHVEFKQVYIITIKEQQEPQFKLNYSIDYGQFSTHPKIVIDSDSHMPYKTYKPKDFYILLAKEVNKIKAENGILVNIFDDSMIRNLKGLTKHIYAGKFKKPVRIPIFEGLKPEITIESALILWFEQKESKNQIIEVEEGELLVEYKKPKYGLNGLNARGEQIDTSSASNIDDFKADIDENSISIVEDEDKKLYSSKIKGYVDYTKDSLKVDTKLTRSKLSRVQDSISQDEDNNIEVLVSQHDTTQDSIGEGVKLKSETIHVNGHIGAKSVLEALKLQIDGATHQDSLQFSKFAKINRHKGTLRCHEAEITLLEGGEIHATNVHVESCIGGIIYAQNVKIDHVKSNLKVYASHSISIRLVSGEENLFKINYKDIPILKSKVDLIHKDIDNLKYTLEEVQRHDKTQVPIIKEKIKKLKDEYETIKNSSKDATITIDKALHGLNVINFALPNGAEIIYKTEAMKYDPFYLEFKDDKVTLHPVNKSINLS